MERLELIKHLENHFDYIRENRPVLQQQLIDCLETLSSVNLLSLDYHALSLGDIMEAGINHLQYE